jgi:hypothetical protein
MRYEVTTEVESIVSEFRRLANELEASGLGCASSAARSEWQAFRRQWPSEEDFRTGIVYRSIDDLAWMLGKTRRFRAIVAPSAPPAASSNEAVGSVTES